MEQLDLDAISKQLEAKKVIGSSQHVFTKGKSCLASLVAFYDVITVWVNGEKAAGAVQTGNCWGESSGGQ